MPLRVALGLSYGGALVQEARLGCGVGEWAWLWLLVLKSDLKLMLWEARGLFRLGLCVYINLKALGSKPEEGGVTVAMRSGVSSFFMALQQL